MYFQFIDVRGDVGAFCVGGQSSLFHAEEGRGKRVDAFLFELAAGVDAFPCARNLDGDTRRVVLWADGLVERYDTFGSSIRGLKRE